MAGIISLAIVPATATAQRIDPSLKFEVASLKPAAPDQQGGGIRPAPGGERYVAANMPLNALIMTAYRLKADQITGGPGWIETDRFDMNAKAEQPSSVDELHVMLQNLLIERFNLKFHYETKELPVYALTLVGPQAKLQPHEAGSSGDPWIDVAGDGSQWKAKFAPMDYFAWRLGIVMDRPVIDRTGLKGGYDFNLTFASLNNPDADGPTLFQALREQLGLKLESQKGPVQIMVIDRADRLSGN